MELDDLKKRAKSITAPDAADEGSDKSAASLEGLLRRLKEEDARERVRLRRIKIFFGVAAVLYAGIFCLTWILPPDGPPERSRMTLALATLVFVTVATVSMVRARRIASIDYSSPVETFLRESDERYGRIRLREAWLYVPFVLIVTLMAGLGWTTGFSRYFPQYDESTGLISFAVFWVTASVLGGVIGMIWWKKHREPLLNEIRRLREELASEQ